MKHRVRQLGSGRTINISSGGVLFTPHDNQKIADVLNAKQLVELALDWPLRLQNTCPLKLVVRGRIIRRDGESFALRTLAYEFRTAGIAARERFSPAAPPSKPAEQRQDNHHE